MEFLLAFLTHKNRCDFYVRYLFNFWFNNDWKVANNSQALVFCNKNHILYHRGKLHRRNKWQWNICKKTLHGIYGINNDNSWWNILKCFNTYENSRLKKRFWCKKLSCFQHKLGTPVYLLMMNFHDRFQYCNPCKSLQVQAPVLQGILKLPFNFFIIATKDSEN